MPFKIDERLNETDLHKFITSSNLSDGRDSMQLIIVTMTG